MRFLLALLFVFLGLPGAHANELPTIEKAAFTSFSLNGSAPPPTNPTYVLPTGSTLKFMNPGGNDSCNGTSPSLGSSGNCAWLTANHAVNCGDVIIAAAGSYTTNFQTNKWGAVSNCPSTTGGIDGAGGVYFAAVVCAGPLITSCPIAPVSGEATRVDASNWAVEGFTATSTGTCFSSTSESSSVVIHHVAFINDIASGCASSGFNSYSFLGTTSGVDQIAVVGAISYNAASSASNGNCTSGISIIPNNGPDTSAGTHIFIAGYFGYKNVNGAGCSGTGQTTDGEGVIFDSWACGLYTQQGVIEQSAVWLNGGAGFEAFPNCTSTNDLAQTYVKSFTAYGDYTDPFHTGSANGELLLQNVTKNTGATRNVSGSIFQATMATPGGAAHSGSFGNPVFGTQISFTNTGPTSADTSVNGNYIWQSNPGSSTTTGSPNTSVFISGAGQGSSFIWGTNTYNDAGFAAAGSLPTTAPSCSAYTNTTDCMNTGASVAADLTPSGGAAGLGYKSPGACASDALYPGWLKGVVYLQWNGTALTENAGLITKPCGL